MCNMSICFNNAAWCKAVLPNLSGLLISRRFCLSSICTISMLLLRTAMMIYGIPLSFVSLTSGCRSASSVGASDNVTACNICNFGYDRFRFVLCLGGDESGELEGVVEEVSFGDRGECESG